MHHVLPLSAKAYLLRADVTLAIRTRDGQVSLFTLQTSFSLSFTVDTHPRNPNKNNGWEKSHYFFILWLVKQGGAITAQLRLMGDMGLSYQSKERESERTERGEGHGAKAH